MQTQLHRVVKNSIAVYLNKEAHIYKSGLNLLTECLYTSFRQLIYYMHVCTEYVKLKV